MRRNDYLLCLVIITAALCGFWYSGSTAADSNAVVRITRHHELIRAGGLADAKAAVCFGDRQAADRKSVV